MNKFTYEQLKEMQNERLTEFKKVFKDMIATSDTAYRRNFQKTSRKRERKYTSEQIRQIVEQGDAVERAALSEHFFTTNGLYKRIILHYATFLTYSWILVPYVNKRYDIADKKISKCYYDAADFCTNFQIERKCALFAKDVLVKGGYYGLLHDEGEHIVIQDLPFEYCRSRFKNSRDVDIVEFNLSFFDSIYDEELREAILNAYPKFILKACKKYRYHNGEKWLFLPAEIGIYFCFFEEKPFFLDLIPLLDDFNDYKEIDKQRNINALKSILVQKVPRDGMNLVFAPLEAEEMHEGAVEMLADTPDIDVLTTYNDVQLLDLGSSDDEKTEINDVQDLIYASAGLSKELFFATTEAGLNYSMNNDLALVMVLGEKFAHFFTVLLNYKFANKKITFKLIILPLSYYNSADYTSRARELASFGYSFLTPILSTGLDQTNLTALKNLENDLLELDEILKPLQSSYTQSGKKAGEPIGDVKVGGSDTDNKNDTEEKEKQETKQQEEKQETANDDKETKSRRIRNDKE